ncbi:MAG: protein kinase [Kiritimatiellia bacterium]
MSEENDEQIIPTPSDFGHFLLEKELGHGGMGGVYLARDKMLDRKVAIKVMLKSLGDDPAFVERFQREAQAAARLNHPNIAQIYSFGQEDGMPYIAMELVSGGSLDKEMEANPGKMDPVRVMRIGQQMADALALAADQGLVHGDVKPENVLIDTDGNAKLVDFGLAAMQGDSSEIWGTPYYISPEKVRRQKIDYRADIYSLGGTLYHALTGVAPFEGADATEVVKARFNGPPKKPSEVRPELSPEIDPIIMRMLEVEPSMRYPTYQSLLGDFKRFLSKAGPVKTSKMAAPKVKIRGTKINMKLTAEEQAPAVADIAELDPIEGEEGDGKKHLGVGAIVGMVAGGVVLLIMLVVGGLFWYVHAEQEREKREAHQQLVETRDRARSAVETTLKSVEKFGVEFQELVAKGDKEMAEAVRQLKAAVPDDLKAVAMPFIEAPPTKDIADAIAFTNQLFAAAAQAKAAVEVKPAGTNAVAAAGTNAVAAVAGTNTVAAAAGTNAVAAAAGTAKKAPAEAKPAEEEAEEEPEIAVPAAVRQFIELWADVYACRAANIRVQGSVKLLLEKGKAVEKLTGEDEATVRALAKLSQTLVEGFEQIKGMKCVEQTQRKAAVIRTRSVSLVRTAQQQIKRMVDKAAREAKAKAEKEAKEAAAAKAAEERKAKAEEEAKAAQTMFDALVDDRLKSLDWEPALRQLQRLLEDTTTPEGKDEVRSQMTKVQYMQELQRLFIAKAKGFRFKDGAEVSAVDPKTITIQAYTTKKGKRIAGRAQKIEWRRFYGKKDNVGYMNQLLNELVLKGRDRLHTGPLPWSKQMLGAALTLQLLYTEVEGAAEVAPVYVKKAAKEFEECAKWAQKWFPDVKLEVE